MLERRPLVNDRLSAERESYLRYQQLFKQQCAIGEVLNIPVQDNRVPQTLSCRGSQIPEHMAYYYAQTVLPQHIPAQLGN